MAGAGIGKIQLGVDQLLVCRMGLTVQEDGNAPMVSYPVSQRKPDDGSGKGIRGLRILDIGGSEFAHGHRNTRRQGPLPTRQGLGSLGSILGTSALDGHDQNTNCDDGTLHMLVIKVRKLRLNLHTRANRYVW